MPDQGILIKIQSAVTNRSEQSLISTRVRRGLALITAHLEETIKWIDKLFERSHFLLAFGQEWISFIYSTKRKQIHLSSIDRVCFVCVCVFFFSPQKYFHQTFSARRCLSWLGGWLKECLCYLCLCWPAKAHSAALTTSHHRFIWRGTGCRFRSIIKELFLPCAHSW